MHEMTNTARWSCGTGLASTSKKRLRKPSQPRAHRSPTVPARRRGRPRRRRLRSPRLRVLRAMSSKRHCAATWSHCPVRARRTPQRPAQWGTRHCRQGLRESRRLVWARAGGAKTRLRPRSVVGCRRPLRRRALHGCSPPTTAPCSPLRMPRPTCRSHRSRRRLRSSRGATLTTPRHDRGSRSLPALSGSERRVRLRGPGAAHSQGLWRCGDLDNFAGRGRRAMHL
mmetsp:Transcript_80786/g.234321  ORF Transcript_80786/g.234321 Transcript_80786/m.234321 type:complete len:226 (-) Transcript_80786:237-914(-)